MLTNLIWFVTGLIVASIVWFFIWRNNKGKITKAVEQADAFLDKTGLDPAVRIGIGKIKDLLKR